MPNTVLNRSTALVLTNKSGTGVSQGDVVVLSSAFNAAFDVVSAEGYTDSLMGVVADSGGIGADAKGGVILSGYAPKINLNVPGGSPGQFIRTSGLRRGSTTESLTSGSFGMVVGSGTSPAAVLFGNPLVSLGVSGLSELSDVSILSPSSGDGIVYELGAWTNKPTKIACRLHKSSTQAVTGGNTVTVQWDVEDFDYGGFFDIGSPTRITIPIDGVYFIAAGVHYNANSVVVTEIMINGATEIARQAQGNSGVQEGAGVSTLYEFSAGEYVEVRFYAGASGNIQTIRTHFDIALLSRSL